MKTLLVILIVVVVGVGVYMAISGEGFELDKENLTNYPPKNEKVVAFGDSLIVGIGSPETEGFIGMLEKRIDREIENFGVSGDTTEMALARINEALATDPGVVIILLGGNDYLRQIEKEKTMENLVTIIQKFQAQGAVTFLLGVRGGFLKDNYESAYRNVAADTGSAYVPNVLDGLIGEDEFMYDTIHPNQKGYEVIADRVEPVLREITQ